MAYIVGVHQQLLKPLVSLPQLDGVVLCQCKQRLDLMAEMFTQWLREVLD